MNTVFCRGRIKYFRSPNETGPVEVTLKVAYFPFDPQL